MDIHELAAGKLAAGKLAALCSRKQARDLYDSHQLLQMKELDPHQLRIGFVVYGAMSRSDWREVSVADVDFDLSELSRQLVPTLRIKEVRELTGSEESGARLVEECRQYLSQVLPFTEEEKAFLDLHLDRGEIDASLLTSDAVLQDRISRQPQIKSFIHGG